MGEVLVTVHGRGYEIACNPGEEPRVTALAAEVERRIRALPGAAASAGDPRFLLLVALLLADELDDARATLPTGTGTSAPAAAPTGDLERRLGALAARIEAVAARLRTP